MQSPANMQHAHISRLSYQHAGVDRRQTCQHEI